MSQQVIINVTDAQQDALRVMNKLDDAQEMAEKTFASRVKGAINTYRNGNKVRDENGDVVRVNGVEQYKGGLKQTAEAAYEMVAATCKLPVTKAEFVAAQLAEVDAIIARISAKETTTVPAENGDDE